jgi:hypothetical protein
VRHGPDVLSVGAHDKNVWESGSAGLRKGDPFPIGRERVGQNLRAWLEVREPLKPMSIWPYDIDLRLRAAFTFFVRAEDD